MSDRISNNLYRYGSNDSSVEIFREFFEALEKSATHRKPLRSEVIEIVEETTHLDPLSEVVEVQRMINANNTAFATGTLSRNAKPWHLKRTVIYTGYLIKPDDTSRLLALAQIPNRNLATGLEGDFRTMANNVMITPRLCPPHILAKVGGLGHKMRWRVTATGSFDNKVWAARVEPVPKDARYQIENAVPMVVLAVKGYGKPIDSNRIQKWTQLMPEQMFDFETEVGEKVTLRIEEERPMQPQGLKRSGPVDEEHSTFGAGRGAQGRRRDFSGKDKDENRRGNLPGRGRGGGQKIDRFEGRGGGAQRGGRIGSGGGVGGGGGGGGAGPRARGGHEGVGRGRGRGGYTTYRSLDDEVARGYGLDGANDGLAY